MPIIRGMLAQTRCLSDALVRFVREPLAEVWQAFVAYVPDLGFVIVIGVLAWLAHRPVRWFLGEVERQVFGLPQIDPKWAPTTAKIASALVFGVAVVMAFPYLPGSSSPAFQGVGIFVGLVLSLSSSSAVANIDSGMIQTRTGSLAVGDVVRIGNTLGVVVAKSLLVTRMRTLRNEGISIPNAVVLGAEVTNLSLHARREGLILHTTVTIGYDLAWRTVRDLLLEAAAGVEILSPGCQALRDGNTVTVPPASRPADYRPSGFRIEPGA